MNNQTRLALSLIGAGLGGAAAFAGLARAVRTRRADALDDTVRGQFPRARSRRAVATRAVQTLGYSGKWWVHGPIAAAAATQLWRTGHPRAGAAIALASGAGVAASKAFEAMMFGVRQPAGHPEPDGKSFPSGHSLELAALALTAGYVVVRERLAPAAIAVPLALAVPVASGAGRLYLDRHWGSDVIGGWMAGLALASWCAAAYELVPERALVALPKRVRRVARAAGTSVAERTGRAAERVVDLAAQAREELADTGRSVAKVARVARRERGPVERARELLRR